MMLMKNIHGILLPLLALLLVACSPEEGSSAPEPTIPVAAVDKLEITFRLDAEKPIITSDLFDVTTRYSNPYFDKSYSFYSYHVVTSEAGYDYIVDLFFVKTNINTWQVTAATGQSHSQAYTLKFSPRGVLDYEATAHANGMTSYAPLSTVLNIGENEAIDSLNLEINFSATTQYALNTSPDKIAQLQAVPANNNHSPLSTTYVDLNLNLHAGETLPISTPFDVSDIDSYNHATTLTVFDSLGIEHTLFFYFEKRSINLWRMHLQLSDSGADEDGLAEMIGNSPVTSDLTFNNRGRLETINGVDALPLHYTWSIDSGANEVFELLIAPSRLTQQGYGFSTTLLYADGGITPREYSRDYILDPLETTLINMDVNLDSNETLPVIVPFNPADHWSYNHSTALSVFNSLGIEKTAFLYFVKTSPNHWSFYITVDNGEGGLTISSEVPLVFDISGNFISLNGQATTMINLYEAFGDEFPDSSTAPAMRINIDFEGSSQYGADFSRTLSQNGGFSYQWPYLDYYLANQIRTYLPAFQQ